MEEDQMRTDDAWLCDGTKIGLLTRSGDRDPGMVRDEPRTLESRKRDFEWALISAGAVR